MNELRTNGFWRGRRRVAGGEICRTPPSPGFARTVLVWVALGFVWIEAVRDVLLTQHMIRVQGDTFETNLVARALTWNFGRASLLPFKLAALTVFTVVLGVLMRRNRPMA